MAYKPVTDLPHLQLTYPSVLSRPWWGSGGQHIHLRKKTEKSLWITLRQSSTVSVKIGFSDSKKKKKYLNAYQTWTKINWFYYYWKDFLLPHLSETLIWKEIICFSSWLPSILYISGLSHPTEGKCALSREEKCQGLAFLDSLAAQAMTRAQPIRRSQRGKSY